jgi:hypothetical protein
MFAVIGSGERITGQANNIGFIMSKRAICNIQDISGFQPDGSNIISYE